MMAADLLEPPTLSRRGTVLVVDDEDGVRASIRAILEGRCEVLEAETGAAALEVLRARDVDLVMLDQRMPGEPGIDVLPRVKAADPSTVVVLATAVHDVRTAVEALKRGAYDYITKPFDVDDILMLVERMGGEIVPAGRRRAEPRQGASLGGSEDPPRAPREEIPLERLGPHEADDDLRGRAARPAHGSCPAAGTASGSADGRPGSAPGRAASRSA